MRVFLLLMLVLVFLVVAVVWVASEASGLLDVHDKTRQEGGGWRCSNPQVHEGDAGEREAIFRDQSGISALGFTHARDWKEADAGTQA